jgi:divalent metal cation (Fe/Co/Zn/Cd) transporter
VLKIFRDLRRVIDAETQRAQAASRGMTFQAVGWFVVAGLGLMGLAMLLLAAFLALSEVYGHTVAALIVGGVILLLAVVVALFVGRFRSRGAEREAREAAKAARDDLLGDFSQIAALLEGFGAGRSGGGGADLKKLMLYAAIGLGFGAMSKKFSGDSKKK